MSDKFVIVSRFSIRARFNPQKFYPQETALHEVGSTDTFEEALEVLASIKAHGGYDRAEIERRAQKREHINSEKPDGTPVLDCYHPHLIMRASEYARTKKVYRLFKRQIKERFGRDLKTDSEVYRHYLLMMNEHCARELKITGDGVFVVVKMMLPLPREEWLKPKKNGCGSK